MAQGDSILQYVEAVDATVTDSIPHYYRESFFAKDTLYCPELPAGSSGVASDPVPYNIGSDDVITSLLLFCFVLMGVSFSGVRGFISRQFKGFFYIPHEGTTEVTETAGEVRFQVYLVVQTALLLALLYYFYTLRVIGGTFMLDSQYWLIAIYAGILMAYFLLKYLLYGLVNNVFFGSKRNGQWVKSMLFLTALEGMLLFPIVLMQGYFDITVENVETYFVVVLIFVKLLTIYKCFSIFFRQKVFCLQIILYLCALEIVPLLAVWLALGFAVNNLKIIF